MFNLSTTEILIILAVAMIVLGPDQLPKVAAKLGKGLRDIQRAANAFKREVAESARIAEQASDPPVKPSTALNLDKPEVRPPAPLDPYAHLAEHAKRVEAESHEAYPAEDPETDDHAADADPPPEAAPDVELVVEPVTVPPALPVIQAAPGAVAWAPPPPELPPAAETPPTSPVLPHAADPTPS